MRNWLDIEKGAIFRDKTKNGLLFEFLKEYKEEFGGSINPNCSKCLEKYYNNYLNSLKMEVKKHGFILLKKYNGISLNSRTRPLRNADMTEAQAIELLENHPHGALLFDKIPKSYYKKDEPKKAKKQTRKKK